MFPQQFLCKLDVFITKPIPILQGSCHFPCQGELLILLLDLDYESRRDKNYVIQQYKPCEHTFPSSVLLASILLASVLLDSVLLASVLLTSVLLDSVLLASVLLDSALLVSVLLTSVLLTSVLLTSVLLASVLLTSVLLAMT